MRVLVLEDDLLVARSLRRMLNILGHDAVHVETCEEGVALFRDGAQFEAVIADLGLANGASGATLLDWVRKHRPAVRRILTSGVNPPATFKAAPPMEVFLPKPFEPDDLEIALTP